MTKEFDSRAVYFDCSACGGIHPAHGWTEDCRNDAQHFSVEELDEEHGERGYTLLYEEEINAVFDGVMTLGQAIEQASDPKEK